MIVAHPALPVIFHCSLPRKATAITFQKVYHFYELSSYDTPLLQLVLAVAQ